MKTRGNTPKYGTLYHASYINKAKPSDKGKISRYIANKCALAARLDAYSFKVKTRILNMINIPSQLPDLERK